MARSCREVASDEKRNATVKGVAAPGAMDWLSAGQKPIRRHRCPASIEADGLQLNAGTIQRVTIAHLTANADALLAR
jgi:hypothetical protein